MRGKGNLFLLKSLDEFRARIVLWDRVYSMDFETVCICKLRAFFCFDLSA
jgi:hypothetical protein